MLTPDRIAQLAAEHDRDGFVARVGAILTAPPRPQRSHRGTSGRPRRGWPPLGPSDNSVMSGPTPWTMYGLRFRLTNFPGAGKSWTAEVEKNLALTPLATVISGGTTEGTSNEAIEVNDGNWLNMRLTPSNTPAAPGHTYWSAIQYVEPRE